jgi:hypothetical protein
MKHLKGIKESLGTKFIAILKQSGGCDYTIACGIQEYVLNSTNIEDAKIELSNVIVEDYPVLESAEIYEVNSTYKIDLNNLYKIEDDKKKAYKNSEKERKEKEDFERLSKKYGR